MVDQPASRLKVRRSLETVEPARLSGSWLALARAGWLILFLFALALFAASLPGYAQKFSGQLDHLSATGQNAGTAVLALLSALASLSSALLSIGLATVFYRRRFSEPMAAALAFYLLLYGVIMSGPLETWAAYWQQDGLLPLRLQGLLIGVPSVGLLFLFPNGRFVPAWSRWLLLLTVPWGIAVFLLPSLSFAGPYPASTPLMVLVALGLILFYLLGVYAQVHRFRYISSPEERQQTKWVVYGFTLWLGYIFLSTGPYFFLTNLPPDAPVPWWASASVLGWFLALNFVPVSLAIALLRYRLWDIDFLINRTLVYGLLTALGIGLYILLVGAAGAIFQQNSSSLALLFTAVLVGVLFKPLRSRLRQSADRLVPVVSERPVFLRHESTQSGLDAEIAQGERQPQAKPILPLIIWYGAMILGAAGIVLLALNWSTQVPPRWGFRGFQLVINIPSVTGGLLLSSHRPRSPIGWLFLLSGFLGVVAGFGEGYAIYAILTRPGLLPGGHFVAGISDWLWLPSMGLIGIFVFLLFPNGRFLSKRWRTLGWLGGAWIIMGSVRYLIEPGPLYNLSFTTNPFGIERIEDSFFFANLSLNATLGIGLIFMGLAAFSLILRYRQSGGEVRQQIKWVAYTAAFLPLTGIIGQFDGIFPDLLLIVIIGGFSTSIWISILHYRLYDIDLLINRTLVYGALTACVILVYALVVGALSTLFQAQGNWIVALIATGLVAVLFQPLRERWQLGVNQLLYGRRDEPFEVLARLGQQLESTMSHDTIYPTIVETVAQTLKLPYVAIAVKKGKELEIVESVGQAADTIEFPLSYRGEMVGQLLVSHRSPDELFTEDEERLLRNVARQAGTAVQALQLTADLQLARQQIVASREEERRRLRRDLHDGLGPTLAAQLLKVGSARALLEKHPEMTESLLTEMESDIETTLTTIRRIVYDLRPPALDQLGLVGALRAYAESCRMDGQRVLMIEESLPDTLNDLPAAVEVAAYHIAREGLTNVVRHGQAKHCHLKLTVDKSDNCRLRLTISDDGVGFSQKAPAGVGLTAMQERAAELGGSCQIKSTPGEGTTVTAVLPLKA